MSARVPLLVTLLFDFLQHLPVVASFFFIWYCLDESRYLVCLSRCLTLSGCSVCLFVKWTNNSENYGIRRNEIYLLYVLIRMVLGSFLTTVILINIL